MKITNIEDVLGFRDDEAINKVTNNRAKESSSGLRNGICKFDTAVDRIRYVDSKLDVYNKNTVIIVAYLKAENENIAKNAPIFKYGELTVYPKILTILHQSNVEEFLRENEEAIKKLNYAVLGIFSPTFNLNEVDISGFYTEIHNNNFRISFDEKEMPLKKEEDL